MASWLSIHFLKSFATLILTKKETFYVSFIHLDIYLFGICLGGKG